VGKVSFDNAIHSSMHPIYGDKYFTRPSIRIWCKKLAHSHESVVGEEWHGCPVVLMTDAVIAVVSSLIQPNLLDRRDKCLSEFFMMCWKGNINVYHKLQWCLTLAKLLWAKYCTDCLKYEWHRNSNVICIKLNICLQINELLNVYFTFFVLWKLIEWRRFMTYLWNNFHQWKSAQRDLSLNAEQKYLWEVY